MKKMNLSFVDNRVQVYRGVQNTNGMRYLHKKTQISIRRAIVSYTLFFYTRNIVFFPAQAEYSYFSADFRLKIFLRIFLD